MHEIGLATKQYHLDYKKYPRTLLDLKKYMGFETAGPTPPSVTSRITGGRAGMLCSEDLRIQTVDPATSRFVPDSMRSSYGGVPILPPGIVPVPTCQPGVQTSLQATISDCGSVSSNPENGKNILDKRKCA